MVMLNFIPRTPKRFSSSPRRRKRRTLAVTLILRSSCRSRIRNRYISFLSNGVVSTTIFPFGVQETCHSAFDATVIGIAIPTQSGDCHCWFYGQPTTVSLLQLFEGERLCVGRQHRFSASTPFRSRTFSTAVLCRRASRFDSLIELRSCLLSGSTPFPLNRNTFSNRIIRMYVRQLDARLFRHGRNCFRSSAATNRMTRGTCLRRTL